MSQSNIEQNSQAGSRVTVDLSGLAVESLKVAEKFQGATGIPGNAIERLLRLSKSDRTKKSSWTADLTTSRKAVQALRTVERSMVAREEKKYKSNPRTYLWSREWETLENENHRILLGPAASSSVWQGIFDLRNALGSIQDGVRTMELSASIKAAMESGDNSAAAQLRTGSSILSIAEYMGLNTGENDVLSSFMLALAHM